MVQPPPGSLREGAGRGAYHSTNRPKTAAFRAIFIAPTETQNVLHSTTHRGTLPQSRPLGVTAPSEREPGTVAGADTIQPGTCETVGLRAIFIAPTKLRMFNRSHSSGDTPSVTPLRACQLPQRGSRERHRPAGYHSSYRPETMTLRAIFIAPTKL